MNKSKYNFFPQGIATGTNFCNRVKERQELSANINSCRPTLIMSPRRYGKTSLVLFVLNQMKLPFAQIDLYSETNEIDVQNTIIGAIGDIIYSIESAPQKAFRFITDFFSDLNIGFTIENAKIKMRFAKQTDSPAKNILTCLKKFDAILESKNKKAIFFMDEFQRLTQISETPTIEGSLRHIAQSSKNIAFIFSGSNRNLLSTMFDDKNKPLYKLCDRMILQRISKQDYVPFIQEKAKIKWNKALSEDTIEVILNIAELHPYYVNVLCSKLWRLENMPNKPEIDNVWHHYASEEKTNVLNEIDLLSTNQSKMLITIAKYNEEIKPMSKEFLMLHKFSLSSASQSVSVLEKKDYIRKNNNKYHIIDPLIKYIFSHEIL